MARKVLLTLAVLGLHALVLRQFSIDPAQPAKPSPSWMVTLSPAAPLRKPAPTAQAALPTENALPSRAKPSLAQAVTAPAAVTPAATRPDAAPRTEVTSGSATDSAPRSVTLVGTASSATDHRASSPSAGATAVKPTIQLPSSDADYLHNPPPSYPGISLRLGEQGKVMLHLFISKDGRALQGEIQQSSGFERLDQAALRAAMNWRYRPGRRDGVAEDMWYTIPVIFGFKAE